MHFASKLDQLEKRFDELTQQMADPAIISDSEQYRKVTKAQSEMAEVVAKYREWKKVEDGLQQARAMVHDSDADLRSMAEMEILELEPRKATPATPTLSRRRLCRPRTQRPGSTQARSPRRVRSRMGQQQHARRPG